MFDPKCYELAEHFLDDNRHASKDELAQWVQDAVEDWLRINDPHCPDCGGIGGDRECITCGGTKTQGNDC